MMLLTRLVFAVSAIAPEVSARLMQRGYAFWPIQERPHSADTSVDCVAYGGCPMEPNLSEVRWIDLDASLSSACSWCRHSEFIHTDAGPCLFSECKCPRFFPMVDLTENGQRTG